MLCLFLCRCVADEQRTLALGLQSLIFRAFGSIPGPIVFGVIFDSTCLFWQFDCDRRGNCWVYDNIALSNRALGLALSGVALNFLFTCLSWLLYPKSKADTSEKADDVKKGEDSASVASTDSHSIEGPAKHVSTSSHLESHCNEDVLHKSTNLGHDEIPIVDVNDLEVHSAMYGDGIVETETALTDNMHNTHARSFGSTSPVQIVANPPNLK